MANTKAGGDKRWNAGFDAWVAACREKHGDRYQYSRERVKVGGLMKVRITCPDHGEFIQLPVKHKGGQGCPKCSHGTDEDRLAKLQDLFPDVVFPNPLPKTKAKMTLTCGVHGEFTVTINQLLTTKADHGGKACPKCNVKARGLTSRLGRTKIHERLVSAFPNYTFSLPEDVKTTDYITYTCPEHGEKLGKVLDLVSGHGCNDCAIIARGHSIHAIVGSSVQDNLNRLADVHSGALVFYREDLTRTHQKVRAICPKHGRFESMLYSLKAGHGCPSCNNRVSKPEREIAEWLRGLGVEVTQQCSDTLDAGTLDILLPNEKVAIEYCGLYWHSDDKRGREYHLNKLKGSEAAGVRLLTVFEDEWLQRQAAVKSTILKIIGKQTDRVFARNTTVEKVAWGVVSTVYAQHHLQGPGSPCADNFVLTHGGEVVAAMSFKQDRFGDNDVELMRYVTTTAVVGGFSKLLKAYKKTVAKGTKVVSYCDLRWFTGNVYARAGFVQLSQSAPGYWWCKGAKRYSRVSFQKHKLMGKLKVFDESMTEEQNMQANGFWKVWDCGMGKWVLEV